MSILPSNEPSVPSDPDIARSHLDFLVVGIGASAGGLAAIETFFRNMPSDAGMAFVVVMHLSPKHDSRADQILQRCTGMPVRQVSAATAIEKDTVYVIAPRHTLSMDDGHLRVSEDKRVPGPHVSIDLFFRTLAQAHRDRAVGIILSGTGSDGTLGAATLKELGGVCFAQAPGEAEFDDMPSNAIASGNVDFVLPVADMPQQLLDLWKNARDIRLPASSAQHDLRTQMDTGTQAEQALVEILALLAARSGHDFSHYKRATMLRRMERRLQVRMLKDLPAYRDYLRDHPDETAALLADMLISVTNFFRDRDAFEALEREGIAPLFADRAEGEPVRAWVPGCATGEEAYSLAMLLGDESVAAGNAPAFQVFATDIDEAAIAVARRGSYPVAIVTDVPPGRLRQYFTREQNTYRLKRALRERVLFAAHNALRDPPFSRLDLISCRNLLIYLNRNIQERLLEMFHFALRPGGLLFLGSSESVDAAADLFDVVDKKARIYRARPIKAAHRKTPALPLRVAGAMVAAQSTRDMQRATLSFADLHQRVLEQYAPPSVVIDREGVVVHVSERAGLFLQHPAGVPSHDLVASVLPALRAELRAAVFQALHTNQGVESRPVQAEIDGRIVQVAISAKPFSDSQPTAEFVLVVFTQLDEAVEAPATSSAQSVEVLARMERELKREREQLQSTIEISNASGEELKASNEELQAINEELRSTTEELETSKEELQSVNEELITVNAELKAKVDEMAEVNDDLKNFIGSTDVATVFVDSALNIKRYTPRAESIFSIIALDVGRCLLDITHRLDYPAMAQDVAAVLDTLQSVEREVRASDGRWYMARIRAYQTSTRQVDGAVLTFVDITSLRSAEERLARQRDDLHLALQTSKDYLVIALDGSGTIRYWNRGAEAIFGHTAEQAIGQPFALIFTPEDIIDGAPEHEMSVASATGRAEDERWHLRRDGSRVYCSGITTLMGSAGDGYLKIARDLSEQTRRRIASEAQLAKARAGRADAEAAVALKDEFLAVMSHELKHPLNLINVNAGIITRAFQGGPEQAPVTRRALDTIGRAVRSQSRIVDDLLDLSRVRTGKLALDLGPVDLVAMAHAAVEASLVDAGGGQSRSIEVQALQPEVVVLADPARINQVIWNLLSNALKFTAADGHVTVRVCVEGGQGRLDVVDDGQGIDAASLPRIFEMFGQATARASSASSGLGIGLAVVRQLVEHHHGRVEGSSEGIGQGARFSVWLPMYARSVTAIAQAQADTGPRCAGLSIVVVDDDAATARALATLLELEGAEVRCASGGEQALQLVAERRPGLLLTDIGMPDMDGYSLLARLHALPGMADLPVIALTGFGRESDDRRTRRAGFVAHIAKPVDIDALLARITALARPVDGMDAPGA